MVNPDTQQVFEISDNFMELADVLKTYINRNKLFLKDDERNALIDKQIELLRIAGEINIFGVLLVFEDVKAVIDQLNDITNEVKKTVNQALIVQDAIELAASLVGIGTAILSKDPKMIVENTAKAVIIVREIENKKNEFKI